jgi:hypothetical protein
VHCGTPAVDIAMGRTDHSWEPFDTERYWCSANVALGYGIETGQAVSVTYGVTGAHRFPPSVVPTMVGKHWLASGAWTRSSHFGGPDHRAKPSREDTNTTAVVVPAVTLGVGKVRTHVRPALVVL